MLIAAKGGDADAREAVYKQNLERVRAVGGRTFTGADLDDFSQTVFVEVFESLNTFRGECKLSTWVTGIANHEACAILQRRSQPKNGDNLLVYQGPDETDEEWDEKCLASEDRNLRAVTAKVDVDCLLQTLSPESRTLVELYHLEGLTEAELSDHTGLPVSSVRARISRAMARLKKIVRGTRIDLPPKSH